MKKILVLVVAATAASVANAQPAAADRAAVEAVLSSYKSAIERLDATGTERLFAPDAQIFETGGSEGSYANYLAHHLGPELGHFRSFRFHDYRVAVRFEGPVALATETYRYTIEPKTGAPIERLGVATSILRQVAGRWQILSMHNSSRKPRGS